MDLKDQYREALRILREGGVVALPTDTVYGLVALATDVAAVERVYATKVRDPGQAIPLFVGSVEQADLAGEMNAVARALAERFWPGALTLVVRKRPSFQTRAAAGGDTVGLRVPDDAFLREAAAQLGPLTGTSANIAGQAECRTAAEVAGQLGDSIDFIVEAPVAGNSKPSTIVDASEPETARVLRDGAIDRRDIEAALRGIAALA
jgi:L-threonylcarbamoyladenylate synthase